MRRKAQTKPHWWRVGSTAPRRRQSLRWRLGSTPPLVAWAEIGDWCLISVRLQPDGLFEGRVVDKTRHIKTAVMPNLPTLDEAKKRCAESAFDFVVRRRESAGSSAPAVPTGATKERGATA